MAERDKKYSKGAGECEIDWLSNNERKLLDYFDYVHSLSGMWRNKRTRLWIWFWTFLQVGWMSVYFYSIPFLIERLDLFAHLIHHTVMGFNDFMYIDLMANKKEYVRAVAEGLTKTYNYESQMLRNFHKQLMSARLNKQDPVIKKFLAASAVSLFLYLEFFYILEATVLKNYETMYPIHLPFDIQHPATYTAVVFLQKLTIYVTIVMVLSTCCLIYSAYCHLILEYDVLIYAIKQVNDLVSEKIMDVKSKRQFKDKKEIYNFYCYHFARHHDFIRRYFHNVKKACEVAILSVFFTGLICFACVGITSLSDNLGVKLKFVMIMILQVIVIYGWCWIGEDITSKEEKLRKAVACLPWWLMPKKCHSTILLMLLGCQIPIHLTTPFNQVASKEGFKDMTSSSYSCFSLMYQMKFSN